MEATNGCHNIVEDWLYGVYICADTGEVLGQVIDDGPEWREKSNDGIATGTTLTPRATERMTWTQPDQGIGAYLQYHGRRRRGAQKLLKLRIAILDLRREIGIPWEVVETAMNYAHRLQRTRDPRVNTANIRMLAMVLLYLAARKHGILLESSKLLNTYTGEDLDNDTLRYYQSLFQRLTYHIARLLNIWDNERTRPSQRVKDAITRIASILGANDDVLMLALNLVDARKKLVGAAAPAAGYETLAAAYLLIAYKLLGYTVTSTLIAEKTGLNPRKITKTGTGILNGLEITLYVY